jgi:hypothetical protein
MYIILYILHIMYTYIEYSIFDHRRNSIIINSDASRLIYLAGHILCIVILVGLQNLYNLAQPVYVR